MELADKPGMVEVVYYVDNDDDSYDGLNLFNATKVTGDRIVLSEMWNKCWEASSGAIYGHMGDDIVFRTENWDKVVRDAFSGVDDGILFVYGSDGNGESERNRFGTHGFIHKNWTDTVGHFVPPYFASDYNDLWLNDVAKAIDRHKFVDILTEHMHYSLGKMQEDQNTRDRLARHANQRPEAVYEQKRQEREEEIQKLKLFIEKVANETA